MKTVMVMTVIFLVLLLLFFVTFSLLMALRKADFEEALLAPIRKKAKQKE